MGLWCSFAGMADSVSASAEQDQGDERGADHAGPMSSTKSRASRAVLRISDGPPVVLDVFAQPTSVTEPAVNVIVLRINSEPWSIAAVSFTMTDCASWVPAALV
ncbi:MAG: hypothetical protein EBU53_04880 [Proteobacteria bacterium]|nr:hypothetical protein [Pseudomonadota bacterium]